MNCNYGDAGKHLAMIGDLVTVYPHAPPRDVQVVRSHGWTRGKGPRTFCPL